MTAIYVIITILAVATAAAIWFAISRNNRLDSLNRKLAEAETDKVRLTEKLTADLTQAEIDKARLSEALESLRSSSSETSSRLREEIDRLNSMIDKANSDLSAERQQRAALVTTVGHLEAQIARREEQLAADREEHDKRLTAQMRELASTILRQNSADLKADHEQRLIQLLTPLRENLDSFRKAVTDTYSSESRERFSLTEEIRKLVDLNNTISREARDLTQALRGNNRVQGDWGEMVLEGILRRSGLQEGSEYFIQVTDDDKGRPLQDESGRQLRPDVVVKYPDGRCVVIDSKVSLTAFMEWTSTDDPAKADELAHRHVKSVRAHVDQLARKSYQDYIGESSLDFVMMFIPNEPAYIGAMRHDPMLWQDAYQRKVLIVSPTHLVAGLRLIEQLWSRDKVTRNAIKIAEDAGKMYDKFADFTRDMEGISNYLTKAAKAHADAMTKLTTGTGNLVKRAADLRALGIKASKQLAASVQATLDSNPSED